MKGKNKKINKHPAGYVLETATDINGKPITWTHPGGKLLKLGPETLTDDELLAVLIGPGGGRTAMAIAKDILDNYFSIYGLMYDPYKYKKIKEPILEIKGLKKVKLVRLIAAYELARRLIEHNKNWDDFKPLTKITQKLQEELFPKPQ